VKIRLALLFCLLLSCCLPFTALSRGHGINTGGPLSPVAFLGHTGKYQVAAIFQTNGTISVRVDDPLTILAENALATGVGTNSTNNLVYISFGEAGYLEGRMNRWRNKIMARLVLQVDGKVIKKRCVLKYLPPESGGGLVIVPLLAPPIETPPPPSDTPLTGLWLQQAETGMELPAPNLE
jgi:hypothetical protein